MRKGIATETIFYIVIGIVVVGLLITVAISYTGTARTSSDCRVAKQQFCEQWESEQAANPAKKGEKPKDAQSSWWTNVQKKCTDPQPTYSECQRLGHDVKDPSKAV